MPNKTEEHLVAHKILGTTSNGILPQLSTTERNALTPINGRVIYNTTTDKFQGYAGGMWIDLH